jgi:oxaloacetate decarboxylase alpha subunit
MVPEETREYVRGLYGRPPAPIKPEIRQLILGDQKVVTCRPADLLPPMLPQATDGVDPALIRSEEDIISYCLFPEPALEFFRWRHLPVEDRPSPPADLDRRKEESPESQPPPPPPRPFLAPDDYKEIQGLLEKVRALGFSELAIRRQDLNLSIKAAGTSLEQTAAAASVDPGPAGAPTPLNAGSGPAPGLEVGAPPRTAKDTEDARPRITAPLNGTFYRSGGPGKAHLAEEGAEVAAGQPVCIVEAMKLFNQIKATAKCRVVRFLVQHGQPVVKDQPLAVVELL